MEENDQEVLPVGPALPPGKFMRYKTKLFGFTSVKIINERPVAASISVDGKGCVIPGSSEKTVGILNLLNGFYFGRMITIHNQCSWVLRIE